MTNRNILEIRHLSKSFKGQPVLQDITMEIPEGCIYGLLGPNGAGKSTLLKMMTGILRPGTGEIYFQGHRWSREDLRHADEEFYSGDTSRHGRDHQGMGLFIAKRFLEEQGGFLTFQNCADGMGAEVSLWIICRQPPSG